MARKMNFWSDDGDCDDHIIATFGDAQRARHITGRYELCGGTAMDHTFAKERISLFLREAFVSCPPPRMLAPGFRQQLQTRNATENTFMERHKLMITFLSAAAFAVGCNKEGATSQHKKQQASKAKKTL